MNLPNVLVSTIIRTCTLNKQGQNTPTNNQTTPPKTVTLTHKPYVHYLISAKHTVGFIHHSGKEYRILCLPNLTQDYACHCARVKVSTLSN